MNETEHLRAALEGMVWQFAEREEAGGGRYLTAAGLSALEDAFAALGWDDPHLCTEEGIGCDWPDCPKWATAGVPTAAGYKHLCPQHLVIYHREGGAAWAAMPPAAHAS